MKKNNVIRSRALRYVSVRDREYRRFQNNINTYMQSWFIEKFNAMNKASKFDLKWSELSNIVKEKMLLGSKFMLKRVLTYANQLFNYGLSDDDVEKLVSAIVSKNAKLLNTNSNLAVKHLRKVYEKILAEGLKRGLSEKKILASLKSRMLFSSKTRSKLLVFLTTGHFSNDGNDKMAKKSKRKTKTWVYTFRAKVPREGHLVLNMFTININKKFNVNGYFADFPHDVNNLPLSERANCHCVVLYN